LKTKNNYIKFYHDITCSQTFLLQRRWTRTY